MKTVQPIRQTEIDLYKTYPYIAGWGTYLDRSSWDIRQVIGLAQEEGAPYDSIYRTPDGWVTFDQCRNDYAKIYIGKYVSILTQE